MSKWMNRIRTKLANLFWPHKSTPLEKTVLSNDTTELNWQVLAPTLPDSINYNTPSGADTKVFLRDDATGWYTVLHEVTGISFKVDICNAAQGGTIFTTVFSTSKLRDVYRKFPDIPTMHIEIVSATEYGCIMCMSLNNIWFDAYSSGMAIDDIVLEERYDFSFESLSSWQHPDETPAQANQRLEAAGIPNPWSGLQHYKLLL